MKLTFSILRLALLLSLATGGVAGIARARDGGAAARPTRHARQTQESQEGEAESPERTAAAEPNVAVSLCVASGDVVVRGWDRPEVRARSNGDRLELRLDGKMNAPRPAAHTPHGAGVPDAPNPPDASTPAPAAPRAPEAAGATNAATAGSVTVAPNVQASSNRARRIEVLLLSSDEDEDKPEPEQCEGSGGVELDVPRGASVNLRVLEGDVDVAEVAEAHVEAMSGDADLRRVTRSVEVENLNGSIFLNDSSGRVRLHTMSGDVEAVNVSTVAAGDQFSAKSTSGSVSLDRIAHTRVDAATVSGDVNLSGTLARGGSYTFQTFSGDVTLTLPADVSFKVNAKVAEGGSISSDFMVKSLTGAQTTTEAAQGHLVGIVGAGGAELNLSSFNGALRLRKK